MRLIKKIFIHLFPDPLYDCPVYKKCGCSHVDGMLCDYPKCNMIKEINIDSS